MRRHREPTRLARWRSCRTLLFWNDRGQARRLLPRVRSRSNAPVLAAVARGRALSPDLFSWHAPLFCWRAAVLSWRSAILLALRCSAGAPLFSRRSAMARSFGRSRKRYAGAAARPLSRMARVGPVRRHFRARVAGLSAEIPRAVRPLRRDGNAARRSLVFVSDSGLRQRSF